MLEQGVEMLQDGAEHALFGWRVAGAEKRGEHRAPPRYELMIVLSFVGFGGVRLDPPDLDA
jgi:hypothetical protein